MFLQVFLVQISFFFDRPLSKGFLPCEQRHNNPCQKGYPTRVALDKRGQGGGKGVGGKGSGDGVNNDGWAWGVNNKHRPAGSGTVSHKRGEKYRLRPRIINDVSYESRINHDTPFAWQAQYLVRLQGDACRSAHCK